MGVYEDMANDAGYAYGTNENMMMAMQIEAHRREEHERHLDRQVYEETMWQLRQKEEREKRKNIRVNCS